MSEAVPRSGEQYWVFDTELGACGIAWTERGLTRVQLPEADRRATKRRLCARSGAEPCATRTEPITQAIDVLRRYATGERVDFSGIVLDLDGLPEFHRRIYAAAREVGWGETATYGALARQVGEPGAARAVGQAMGRNPLPLIIPCHRVLAAGNKIGGFSAFGGAVTKERLLALEGVHLNGGTPLLPGLLPALVSRRPSRSGSIG